MSDSDPIAADGDQTTPMLIPSESEDQLPKPDPLLGSGSFIDPSNGGDNNASKEAKDSTTPNSIKKTRPPSKRGDKKASKKAKNSTSPNSVEKTRPSWLPANWDMIVKKRTSGATQGIIDRYYIAPSGQRLRSKNEVLNFIETGSKKKKATPSSDDATSEGSAPPSKKKTSARKKVHAAVTFDLENPPEKVN